MSDDVAAVLAEALEATNDSGYAVGWDTIANGGLAARSAAGIACVYVPEGVAVAHGARLVPAPMWLNIEARRGHSDAPLYAIEDTP